MRLNEDLDDSGELHEINVTPFIDVMLVLLIIFMVAAPLATVDIRRSAGFSAAAAAAGKPVFLSVKADKQLYVGDQPVNADQLTSVLDQRTSGEQRNHHLLPCGQERGLAKR